MADPAETPPPPVPEAPEYSDQELRNMMLEIARRIVKKGPNIFGTRKDYINQFEAQLAEWRSPIRTTNDIFSLFVTLIERCATIPGTPVDFAGLLLDIGRSTLLTMCRKGHPLPLIDTPERIDSSAARLMLKIRNLVEEDLTRGNAPPPPSAPSDAAPPHAEVQNAVIIAGIPVVVPCSTESARWISHGVEGAMDRNPNVRVEGDVEGIFRRFETQLANACRGLGRLRIADDAERETIHRVLDFTFQKAILESFRALTVIATTEDERGNLMFPELTTYLYTLSKGESSVNLQAIVDQLIPFIERAILILKKNLRNNRVQIEKYIHDIESALIDFALSTVTALTGIQPTVILGLDGKLVNGYSEFSKRTKGEKSLPLNHSIAMALFLTMVKLREPRRAFVLTGSSQRYDFTSTIEVESREIRPPNNPVICPCPWPVEKREVHEEERQASSPAPQAKLLTGAKGEPPFPFPFYAIIDKEIVDVPQVLERFNTIESTEVQGRISFYGLILKQWLNDEIMNYLRQLGAEGLREKFPRILDLLSGATPDVPVRMDHVVKVNADIYCQFTNWALLPENLGTLTEDKVFEYFEAHREEWFNAVLNAMI